MRELNRFATIVKNAGLLLISLSVSFVYGQNLPDEKSGIFNLNDCIVFAFKNQPLIKQLKLDEDMANQDIRIALSDWLPQINSSAYLQHNIKQPVSIVPDFSNPEGPKKEYAFGVENNSAIQFSATQTLFDNSVYIAGKSAKYYRRQAEQTTQDALIGFVVEISNAFYSVLLSQQKLKIFNEDIDRLNQSLKDAYAQYQSGSSDKIDYKRATIALNTATAQKIAANEAIKAKMAYMKELIGYPENESLFLSYDSTALQNDILIDTIQFVSYKDRIEFQLLQTNLMLKKSAVEYYRLGFLPSLSGYGNYNIVYQNDLFSELYNKPFPNSNIGLTLSFPIFEGSRRGHDLKKAQLDYEKTSLDTINLKRQINSEYIQAMAVYKSSLAAYDISSENIDIARDVYNTVKLQYNQGIKSYLEVIVSETDLRSAQINNLNALFVVLSSKIDVERALGKISTNY